MNSEWINVYYNLMRLGIEAESVKLFPGTPIRFDRQDGLCFRLETTRGNYALWLVSELESRLLAELEILHILKEKKVDGFLFPIRLNNNCFYGITKNECLFYLTDWLEYKRISFRNKLNIKSLLQLVINYRTTMEQSDIFAIKCRITQKSLIDRYQDMIKSFYSFAMLANCRLHPTKFDRVFLSYRERFTKEAESALKLIQSSAYLNMYSDRNWLRPIINNFSRSNLRALPTGQAICLSLKETLLDLPLMDLALLMIKTGRSNQWGREWYDVIIRNYNESFPLTNEDLKILRAYLAFPWEAYRLSARYYHNRVNWPVCFFVEKMERIVEVEEARNELAQYIKGNRLQ